MLAASLDFLAALRTLAPGWRAWVLGLVVVNLVAPAFFRHQPEAWIVGGVFLAQAAFMLLLFRLQGFTRLLGVAHAGWIGLGLYLFPRLASHPAGTPFGLWLRILFLVNGISLVIDAADVIRYILGERKPL